MPTTPYLRRSFAMAAVMTLAPTGVSSGTPVDAGAETHGTPGPNDHVTCNKASWLFGINIGKASPKGNLVAYPVTNPASAKPAVGAGTTIGENLGAFIVRGSSNGRFFAWNTNNELTTFKWSGNTKDKISEHSLPITPPTPLVFADNRQLRTVDEHGNIYYFNKTYDLMRATVTFDSSGLGTFTQTGEIVARFGALNATPRALWASGDGVLQVISGDSSYAVKIDPASHRITSAVRKTIDNSRSNEDYVGSIGGSVDFALIRDKGNAATSRVARYRYDPASTDPKNYWPVDVETIKKPEFATTSNITGLLDGCTRKDLPVTPLNTPVAWTDNPQTTFTQAGQKIFAAFKYPGKVAGWAETDISSSGSRLKQRPFASDLGIRPPLAVTPEGDKARLLAHTVTGQVLSVRAEDKPTPEQFAAGITTMGGIFPTAPAAAKLSDSSTVALGIDTTGTVRFSHQGC